jgi:hypothetical protein
MQFFWPFCLVFLFFSFEALWLTLVSVLPFRFLVAASSVSCSFFLLFLVSRWYSVVVSACLGPHCCAERAFSFYFFQMLLSLVYAFFSPFAFFSVSLALYRRPGIIQSYVILKHG